MSLLLIAIEAAETRNTVLVGDDTDLLVLLLHHLLPLENKIYFAPEPKKNATGRVWDIKQIQSDLGSFTCKHLLFLHAFLGCDTTSRIYGIGKGSILKKFKDSVSLQQAAIIFNDPNSTHSQVQDAGEKALVAIYGGKKTENLNMLRFRKYSEKVATSLSHCDPKVLPPTAAAAKFHSYCVFLQVNQWKNIDCCMTETSWGWKQHENEFKPIATDIAPAPADLLKIIRCNCSTDCATAKCTCKKNGMSCSVACGHWRGTGRQNASAYLQDEEEQEVDIYNENII